MSIPNVIEEEEILAIDREVNDSFKQIPVSAATIRQWKIFLKDRDHKEYNDDEVLAIIKDDPNPDEYEDNAFPMVTSDSIISERMALCSAYRIL